MPLTGEAKREWQRKYDRERHQTGRKIAKQLRAMVGEGRPVHNVSQAIVAAAQGRLQTILTDQGLTPDLVVAKIKEKLQAGRLFNAYEDVGEKTRMVTITGQDNDAQLRAADLAIHLHERAGTIPSAVPVSPGSHSITLVEVHYHAGPQDVVIDAPGRTIEQGASDGKASDDGELA